MSSEPSIQSLPIGLPLSTGRGLRDQEIQLLRETAIAISGELDLEKTFSTIAEHARQLLHAETLLIPILDEDCARYTYRAGSGLHAAEVVGESLPLECGVCGWVWKHKKAWWRGVLDELSASERNQWEKEAGTLIMVPLVGKQHFLGGIAGINKTGGREFSERDLYLLEVFAAQATIAIENAMAFEQLSRAQAESELLQEQLQQLNKDLIQANRELENLALYDQLTQLPNGSLFRDRLRQNMSQAKKRATPVSLLLIDLDHFKEINDTHGHEVGDELIQQVGARLTTVMKSSETLARLGGDEFAMVINHSDETAVRYSARKILKSLEPAFVIEGREFIISASLGIACFPQHGENVSMLMRHADAAMYRAKRTKSRFCVFDTKEDQAADDNVLHTGDVRQAFEQQAFELYYQPQIDLVTRRITGVEALSRWNHPQRGFIRPDIFISLLEQAGLMHQFTHWVMQTAFWQCTQWRRQGYRLDISLNVTVQDLLDPEFLDRIDDLLQQYDVADQITLELTENLFLSDYQRVEKIMHALRERKFSMSIDDFGTGHSSLSRLKRLPVSEIKIDRSFVSQMDTDEDDAVIVQSTIELAHNLGLTVVAEGVENQQVLHRLARLRCDMAQGFHIGKPMPAAELAAVLKKIDHSSC